MFTTLLGRKVTDAEEGDHPSRRRSTHTVVAVHAYQYALYLTVASDDTGLIRTAVSGEYLLLPIDHGKPPAPPPKDLL